MHFAGRILEAIGGTYWQRDACTLGANFYTDLRRCYLEQARSHPGDLHREEACGELRRPSGQGPINPGRRPCQRVRLWCHDDHGNDYLLWRQTAMEIRPRSSLGFEASEGPRCGDIEGAVHTKGRQRCP